jgi:hypothetical protein
MAMVPSVVTGPELLADSAEVKWTTVDSAAITVIVDSMVVTDPMVVDHAAVVTDNRKFSASSTMSMQSRRLAADVASRFRFVT